MDAQMPPNMAQMASESPPADNATPVGDAQNVPQETAGDGEGSEYLAEVQRGLDGIKTALYKDKNVSEQFLSMINPDKKADSMVRAAILLVTELDKKMDFAEEALAPLVTMAAGELMELAEAGLQLTFSEPEQKQIVMAAFEGILQAYQVDQQASADFIAEVGPEAEQRGISDYQAAMPGQATSPSAQEQQPT